MSPRTLRFVALVLALTGSLAREKGRRQLEWHFLEQLPAQSAAATPSPSATPSYTASASASASATGSLTPTSSATASETASITASSSFTASITPSISMSPSITPSGSRPPLSPQDIPPLPNATTNVEKKQWKQVETDIECAGPANFCTHPNVTSVLLDNLVNNLNARGRQVSREQSYFVPNSARETKVARRMLLSLTDLQSYKTVLTLAFRINTNITSVDSLKAALIQVTSDPAVITVIQNSLAAQTNLPAALFTFKRTGDFKVFDVFNVQEPGPDMNIAGIAIGVAIGAIGGLMIVLFVVIKRFQGGAGSSFDIDSTKDANKGPNSAAYHGSAPGGEDDANKTEMAPAAVGTSATAANLSMYRNPNIASSRRPSGVGVERVVVTLPGDMEGGASAAEVPSKVSLTAPSARQVQAAPGTIARTSNAATGETFYHNTAALM